MMNFFIWAGTVAAALSMVGDVMDEPTRTSPIAPARDGDVAIQEELCAARSAGTVNAYDLFLARHPSHPLAARAKAERAALARRAQQD